MANSIGQKIKELRKKKGITQEQLAELILVTPQAISKWERDVGYPDITQIVPLADAFGVSTDILLNHEEGKQNAEIEKYREKDIELSHKGLVNERLHLWREATQKYPRDFRCLYNLAESLWSSIISETCTKEEQEPNAREAIAICERIVKDCTDNEIRSCALQILVFTYSIGWLECANEEKAVEYANMADGFYTCREMLLPNAYFTKEGQKEKKALIQSNNKQFIDMISMNICGQEYETEKDKIFALETMLAIWNALFYDGNFLFYHCRIANIYSSLAKSYAKEQNKEKTLKNLQKAYYHANKYDNLPELTNYTSIFFSMLDDGSARVSKNYTETNAQLFLNTLNDSCYDFIREEESFKELLSK